MLAIRRKKSQSLADLHDKNIVGREPAQCKSTEESGYDSDTRKSAETVSPKSSDKSDESDSGQDTSGSFTSDNQKDSDTDPDQEPHYQVPRSTCRPITPQKPPRKSKQSSCDRLQGDNTEDGATNTPASRSSS